MGNGLIRVQGIMACRTVPVLVLSSNSEAPVTVQLTVPTTPTMLFHTPFQDAAREVFAKADFQP